MAQRRNGSYWLRAHSAEHRAEGERAGGGDRSPAMLDKLREDSAERKGGIAR
jgi:hypothetical protein